MGARLWRMVEEFRDSQPFPPSVRAIARQAGISESTFANWQHISKLPEREHLEAFARISKWSYRELLDAALVDAGYSEASDGTPTSRRLTAVKKPRAVLPIPPKGQAAARTTGRKSEGQHRREEQDTDSTR
jgi:hypothetical protein